MYICKICGSATSIRYCYYPICIDCIRRIRTSIPMELDIEGNTYKESAQVMEKCKVCGQEFEPWQSLYYTHVTIPGTTVIRTEYTCCSCMEKKFKEMLNVLPDAG